MEEQKYTIQELVNIFHETGECPCCEKVEKKEPLKKTLDMRLVDLSYQALHFTLARNKNEFTIRQVFSDNHHAITDFQKLKYFKIVEKVGKNYLWKFTDIGFEFLLGEGELPDYVYVKNNKEVISMRSNKLVRAKEVSPRWQTTREDWALDYHRLPCRRELKQVSLV